MIVDGGDRAMLMMHAQPVAAAGGGIVRPGGLEGQLASW